MTNEDTSYGDWLKELVRIMVAEGYTLNPDFNMTAEETADSWRLYYEDGLTPKMALQEDCSYA